MGVAALFIAWEHHIKMASFEETWQSGTYRDPQDRGIGYLLWLMEDVMPSEIRFWPLEWIVEKFTCLSAAITSGYLSRQLLAGEHGLLVSRYIMEMTRIISENGIEVKGGVCNLSGQGWETFDSIREARQELIN